MTITTQRQRGHWQITSGSRLTLLAIVLALVAAIQTVRAAPAADLVVFGDSLSDPGNAFALLGEQSVAPFEIIPSAPYAIGGHHFSNGATWVEQMARQLGKHSGPAFSQENFNNFAIGAARARAFGQIYLSMQVSTYLGRRNGRAESNNLYVIFIGANDVRDAIASFTTDPQGQEAERILLEALNAINDNIGALASAGAREFLVVNIPDLAIVPVVSSQGPQVQALASSLTNRFNLGLSQVLTNARVVHSINGRYFDLSGLLAEVVSQPQQFQFTDVTSSCIRPETIARSICPQPDSHLFWDGLHPGKSAHRTIADKVRLFLEDVKD